VDVAKQRRLTRLALYFLQKKKLLDQAARFDVLTVSWPEGQKTPVVEHFKNAFEAVGDVY
jgi:putative endonuclease